MANQSSLALASTLPLVSVVMPTLNQAPFIESAIDSVLSQTYPRLEVVVSDGGSTDGTQDILQKISLRDPRVRWFSEPDNGPAQAINRAIQRSRGTYIGWLNSDDLYTPGAMERAVHALSTNSQWLMVYGHGQHIDREGKVLETYPSLGPETPVTRFANGCFICQPTVFFKRAFWVMLGRLDEGLKTAFDFDYWFRAFSSVPERIGFVHHVQAQSRLYPECITFRLRGKVFREGMQVVARHLGHAGRHWALSYLNELLQADPSKERIIETEQRISGLMADVSAYMTPQEKRLLERDVAIKLGATPRLAPVPLAQPMYRVVSPGPWDPVDMQLAPQWGHRVFEQAISLGFFCHTASALRDLDLRGFSGPFDWIFSSPAVVAHALSDDFQTFLDSSQYEPVPVEKREVTEANICDHKFYRDNFGQRYMFNHHSPDLPKDYEFFVRGISKLREIFSKKRSVLFVAFDQNKRPVVEFQRIVTALRQKGVGCSFLVVRFVSAASEGVVPGTVQHEYGDEYLQVLRLGLLGRSNGVQFLESIDVRTLQWVLRGFDIKSNNRDNIPIRTKQIAIESQEKVSPVKSKFSEKIKEIQAIFQ